MPEKTDNARPSELPQEGCGCVFVAMFILFGICALLAMVFAENSNRFSLEHLLYLFGR